MNKQLIFQIINNKINKIDFKKYSSNFNIDELQTLISALKISKSNNLILNLSTLNFNENDYYKLYKLFNYLKNDTKIIKLNLSNCAINSNISKLKLYDILKMLNTLQKTINNYNVYCNEQLYEYFNNINNAINQLDTTTIKNPIKNIIYETFKNNKTLQSLNISKNNIYFVNLIIKTILDTENNTIRSLNIQNIKFNDKFSINLLIQLINKNILTSLKLNFSSDLICNYVDLKNLLKSIENTTSLKKLSITFEKTFDIVPISVNKSLEILLLLFINSLINNKSITKIKLYLDSNIISINTFNYFILNNRYLKDIIFNNYNWSNSKYTLNLILNNFININDNNHINKNIVSYYKKILKDIKHYYLKKHIDSSELINNVNNIISKFINKEVNIYKDIQFEHISDDYYIYGDTYINNIKNMNLNEFKNDYYKSYYKQLQDKLNSVNIIFNYKNKY